MDVGRLMEDLGEHQRREIYMFQRKLTEEDVYGKHALERYEDRNLAKWIVAPKGMVFAIDTESARAGIDEPILVRDPKYHGEHRESSDMLRRYYDPRFGKNWYGYVGRVPFEQQEWESHQPNHKRDRRGGLPNPVWNRNFFRVKTWGFVHYKHDEAETESDCCCQSKEVMD